MSIREILRSDPSRAEEIRAREERVFESFRPIRNLIENYLTQPNPQRPLSVAVFGPPGSGKSYFTDRLAKEFQPWGVLALHLNLSVLGGPSDLTQSFGKILKEADAGVTPFVIMDEFDARHSEGDGTWLPHFLAPMEGQLWDGTASRRLKRAVFVFVGGAAPTLTSFVSETHHPNEAKTPDFVARLAGYVNLSFPESTARFRNVCKIIVPDFDEINKEMMGYFAAKPEALQDLDWRKFEQLLDAVFRNQGYETVLGSGRADGGIDIRLLRKDSIGAITTLVQAKRYAKRPIELQAVQALAAAVDDQSANRGLFVTTSRYLPVARRFAARQSTKLHLATSVDVARWCDEASRLWPRADPSKPGS